MDDLSILAIAIAATITALATGLGALPLIGDTPISRTWIAHGQASAAGLMFAATTLLVSEGADRGAVRVVFGMVLGVALIMAANRWLPFEPETNGRFGSSADRSTFLLIVLMTVHSFAEGIGVGVAFGDGKELGVLITAAIALHNIPEGLAISVMLVGAGASVMRAALWSIFTSVPQIIVAVPAFLFVTYFEPALPVGLGVAAGAMAWMVVFSLIPSALKTAAPESVATWFTLSMAVMIGFQTLL
jgi:zinc transporter ZupT